MSKRWGLSAANAAIAACAVLGLGLANTAVAQAPECSGKNAQISKSIKKPMAAAFDAQPGFEEHLDVHQPTQRAKDSTLSATWQPHSRHKPAASHCAHMVVLAAERA